MNDLRDLLIRMDKELLSNPQVRRDPKLAASIREELEQQVALRDLRRDVDAKRADRPQRRGK